VISQSNLYFKNLLEHLAAINSCDFKFKNDYWINQFLSLSKELSNIRYLPNLMPLIYPDFLYGHHGNYLGDLLQFNANGFNQGINLSDHCQFDFIVKDASCEFNNYKSIRGKCQADHFWPHSLGGPTILENRVLLCKFHNLAKSNSILDSFWKEYPCWLDDYLTRMYHLKIN
jgi:hypothetical protein